MKNSVIQLEGVWKVYTMGEVEVTALRDVSLEIKKGDFMAITGASGSGKSTMMNLLGCLDLPSKGAIYLDGHNISHLPESELAQIRWKKIGFIFQQFHLVPTLTAIENITLPLEFQDIPTDVARKKARELLNLVGLKERGKHLPSQLSGGEQQRVAVARALVVDPEVVLADEPTGNLDTQKGREVLTLLHNIWKAGKTVVMITHEPNFAKIAHTQVTLRDGRVLGIQLRKVAK